MATYKTIPFYPEHSALNRSGRKIATTRTKRYARKGEVFEDRGEIYRVTHVVKLPLGVVADYFFREEGFDDTEDFVEMWERIYPRKGFDPDQLVWLHLYIRLLDV